jgi:hypothetical protein
MKQDLIKQLGIRRTTKFKSNELLKNFNGAISMRRIARYISDYSGTPYI